MWIESHQSLRNHPKVKKAARLAGISEPEMIGRLHYLWWWAIDYAPDGDVSKYSPDDIESAVDWQGEPGRFYKALTECGFNGHCGLLECVDDRNIIIHDWEMYAGKLLERREANAKRMRELRATHVQDTSRARVGLPTNQPNQPNQPTSEPNQYQAALTRMCDQFSKSTGIPIPPSNTEKEKKSAAVSWWNPLGVSIYKNLCQENIEIAMQLIDLTVSKMRNAKPQPLTITAPRSIEKIAAAVYAEKFNGNGQANQSKPSKVYQ